MVVPQVSVIVPTYNEAPNIVETIDSLKLTLAHLPHEIIVVDDDSPDLTWRIARDHTTTDPTVRVIRRIGDRGLSSAVLAGMAVAEGETLAVIDADGQHDERVLPDMVAEVRERGADICVGTRSEQRGGSYGRWTLRRRLASWVAAVLARMLLPLSGRTTDPLSGYFVVSAAAYERTAPGINPRGFKILLEFIGRGSDLSVAEVGYEFRRRRRGETKLSGAIALNYLIAVLDLRFGRTISPVFLMFCLVGLSGVAVALAGYGIGELAGLPTISPGFTPGLNPIYTSALLGIQLSIVTSFLGNNYLTFHEDRYQSWRLLWGFCQFQVVSLLGVLIHVGVFRLLEANDFPAASLPAELSAVINNVIALSLATVTNFVLHVTLTWRRRGRARRFTYG